MRRGVQRKLGTSFWINEMKQNRNGKGEKIFPIYFPSIIETSVTKKKINPQNEQRKKERENLHWTVLDCKSSKRFTASK